MIFGTTSMLEILHTLRAKVTSCTPGDILSFHAPDPDGCMGCYAGEIFTVDDTPYRHHSWHSWDRLAQLLGCRMLTPHPATPPLVTVRLQKLDPTQSFHRSSEAKYATTSLFARIDKREEPDFLYHYLQALDEVKFRTRNRILDLGVSRGDELGVILEGIDGDTPEMIGIDLDPTAIEAARTHYPDATFYCHDIHDLDSLDLGRIDLLITIGTLQSPAIETKPLIMDLVQHRLTETGALILGFPASRWIDGELLPGAHAPHYAFAESSLLIKDIYWIKKYLQQHRYRVRIFGQSYWFLVATRILRVDKV